MKIKFQNFFLLKTSHYEIYPLSLSTRQSHNSFCLQLAYYPRILFYSSNRQMLSNKETNNNENQDFNNVILSRAEPYKSQVDETNTPKKCLSSGSISGSVTTLCNATLGAGVLSLPYAISKSGIIIGTLLLTFAALCTHFSITLLVEAMHKSKCKSYEEMTFTYYGKYFLILVECCIIVFCLGTNTAYIIAVGDMLEQTLLTYFEDSIPSSVLNRNTLMIGFWGCIMFPVSLCQRINSLRYASFLSTVVTYLLIFAIIYHSIKFMVDDSSDQSDKYSVKLWPDSIQDILLSCPIIMFSFANQINVCQVYNELSHKTPSTMRIVSKYSVLVCLVAYTLTSIFGYINFQSDVDEDILSNYCLGTDPDIFVFVCTVAFVMLGITLSL